MVGIGRYSILGTLLVEQTSDRAEESLSGDRISEDAMWTALSRPYGPLVPSLGATSGTRGIFSLEE